MTIPSSKYLKVKAAKRLEAGKDPGAVVLWYAGITGLAALIVSLAQFFLSDRISQTGGLANLSSRTMLTTISNILPIVEQVLVLCVGLGYLAAMLRISRNQYASPKTLKAGAERFWLLLKTKILQYLLYLAVALPVGYAAMQIFLVSPLSGDLMQTLTPLVSSAGSAEALLTDETAIAALSAATTPIIAIYLALYLPAILFLSYRYRMTDYLIIDEPRLSAVAALRKSRALMKGNNGRLFLLDLSYWWYYVLRVLIMLLLYLDTILPLLGISLPVSSTSAYIGCVVLYLAADFALTIFLRNRIEVAYALAYTSIAPRPEAPADGAVLGNIFQM